MAKKNTTNKSHYEQINLALAHVHYHFGENITAEDLAHVSGYSIFHFHRIFKELTGESVNDYLRNTRLEKASNLLLYNQHQTIETIAIHSGFSSAMGFRTAFKKKFGMTPKEWRKSGYEADSKISKLQMDKDIELLEPQIVNNEPIPMMYMMEHGYKDDLSEVWNNLHEWCEEMGVLKAPHRYLGLFHHHPAIEPYDSARYIACIETQEDVFRNGKIGKCVISKGKFAKFQFKCTHKELYKYMHMAYLKWLPNSKYETRNFPAYVEYKTPDMLLNNNELEVDFYMPIQLKHY